MLLPPASLMVAVIVRSAPKATGSGVATTFEVTGAEVSILTTTETELVPPVLVAVQVNVVPVVGAETVEVPQAVVAVTADSGSVTVQLTVTGVVLFQPATFGN